MHSILPLPHLRDKGRLRCGWRLSTLPAACMQSLHSLPLPDHSRASLQSVLMFENAQGACNSCIWRAAGAITTLGRGGSDLTATVLGAALGVPEVQVWKDVDGAPCVLSSLPVHVMHDACFDMALKDCLTSGHEGGWWG